MRRVAPRASRPAYAGQATTFIHQHRGIAKLPARQRRLLWAVALGLVVTAGWLLLLRPVGLLWGHLLAAVQAALVPEGTVMMIWQPLWGEMALAVPYLSLPAGPPSTLLWWGTLIGTVLGLIASWALPERWVPLRYFLRALVFIQATALLFFVVRPEEFPYTLDDYLHGLTLASLLVVSLVPMVLAFTYYILDFSLRQKLALTACILGYMVLLVPLQYLVHSVLIHHASYLFMPMLYLVGGVPLNVLAFIALYGWGMSWEGQAKASTTPATPPIDPNRAPRRLSDHPENPTDSLER